ncbi:MAG: helix-turn-helix domain-containing protein [Clostridia bacterium]
MTNRLAERRLEAGLSQFELARRANISPSVISQLETGKLSPYPAWRQRLADALGVLESELFPEVSNS